MDWKEYQKRDLELQKQKAEYLTDCYDHEAQIAVNKREIARIDYEQKELYALYKACQEEQH